MRLRIEPYAHGIVESAHQIGLADAGDARQRVHHVDLRVVRQEQAVMRAVRRIDAGDHQEVRLLGADADAEICDGARQLRHRQRDTILHVHLRDIVVGTDREGDGQRVVAARTGGR